MTTPIIDTDTHVIETPDIWTDRLSEEKWGDLRPHVLWNEAMSCEAWHIGQVPVMRAWAHAMAGWPKPFPDGPRQMSEVQASCYNAAQRVVGMDSLGIDMAVLYPNLGLGMQLVPDLVPELSFEIVRAYNDWLLDWTAADPSRFIALACIPYWDVDESVKEIRRCASLGHRGIITTGAPHLHGEPTLAHSQWDPVWATAEETGMPVSFHVGSGMPAEDFRNDHLEAEGPAATTARGSVWTFLENGKHATELLLSGILPRFPKLNFISVESGLGWVPFCLEATDYHFEKCKVWREHPEFESKPSEYFRRQVYVNYWFERLEDHHIDAIGLEHILFETDFPHPTCLEGGEQVATAIERGLGHRSEAVRERVLWRNAAELFGVSLPAPRQVAATAPDVLDE